MKKNRQSQPVSVLDLAAYILANHSRNAPLPAWKMHKLAYFCQALSFVREGLPFFHEKIWATPKGILIEELCPQHMNHLYIGGSTIGNLNHLSLKQVDTLDDVMKIYGPKSPDVLDEMMAAEGPWKEAMQRFDAKKQRSVEIDLNLIQKYYPTQVN